MYLNLISKGEKKQKDGEDFSGGRMECVLLEQAWFQGWWVLNQQTYKEGEGPGVEAAQSGLAMELVSGWNNHQSKSNS